MKFHFKTSQASENSYNHLGIKKYQQLTLKNCYSCIGIFSFLNVLVPLNFVLLHFGQKLNFLEWEFLIFEDLICIS